MEQTTNRLLQKLNAGKYVYGTGFTSTGPMWPAATAATGIDFVFIDTEHIPIDRVELTWLCQVFKSMGISPVVRIPSPDPYRACQVIDGGAEGVVAPYLESVAEVEALAAAVKGRPLKGKVLEKYRAGDRSTLNGVKNYIEAYNASNMCIANIESVPALEHLDELLSVPGLDAVFIGPHDLSVNLGVPEQYDHPVFEEAVKKIIHITRAKGKHIGIHFSMEPERQVRWVKEGANMITHSFDIALFTQRLKSDMDIIRKGIGDEVSFLKNDIPVM